MVEKETIWHTGSGNAANIEDVVEQIKLHTRRDGKVYVGADSQLGGEFCTFVTVICLHGGLDRNKKYFFKKEKVSAKKIGNLRHRINQEVIRSLSTLSFIVENVPRANIEIHVDIGMSDRSRTKPFVDSIVGWVKGLGVSCKVKPDAWASASVADRHTK